MATYRVQMAFPQDSSLPRDVVTINPHFNGTDPQALLAALDTNLQAWSATAGKPWTLKAYDAAAQPPSYPLATVTRPGTPPASPLPREIALCLSYYTTYNRPRYRGRLYLPAVWMTGSPALRPSTVLMNNALSFGTNVLSTALPPAHNWVVWSRTEGKSMGGVDHWWVDDEWDTVRSRGLRATTRVTHPQAAVASVPRPWSERFILGTAPTGFREYVVPSGRRALLTNFNAYSNHAGAADVYIIVAGQTIWHASIPGAGQSVAYVAKLVLYAGEVLQVYASAIDVNLYAGGTLLDDTGQRDSPRAGDRLELPELLPSQMDDETQRQVELVRAFLAGYGQAVRDFRAYAARAPAAARQRPGQRREWWRRRRSTSGTARPKDR